MSVIDNSNVTLFIYGTLRRGCRAEHFMREASAFYIGIAEVNGYLVYIDRYPGLILGGENFVSGELYSINPQMLKKLDNYEGCFEKPPEYRRERVKLHSSETPHATAYSYIFNNRKNHHKVMNYRDWLDFIKDNPELNK